MNPFPFDPISMKTLFLILALYILYGLSEDVNTYLVVPSSRTLSQGDEHCAARDLITKVGRGNVEAVTSGYYDGRVQFWRVRATERQARTISTARFRVCIGQRNHNFKDQDLTMFEIGQIAKNEKLVANSGDASIAANGPVMAENAIKKPGNAPPDLKLLS